MIDIIYNDGAIPITSEDLTRILRNYRDSQQMPKAIVSDYTNQLICPELRTQISSKKCEECKAKTEWKWEACQELRAKQPQLFKP